MRLHLIAASAMALFAAEGASAQRVVMPGPGVGHDVDMSGGVSMTRAPMSHAPMMGYRPAPVSAPSSRWGSRVNGHWWGGMNAPGGWNAYRRPVRGGNLPSYWISPNFAIGDWSGYGLGQPPAGYGWTRYYDDAVLIDGNGRIYDDVNGVDWDRGGGDANDGGGRGYGTTVYSSQGGSVQPTYGQSTYAPGPAGYPAGYGTATAGYPPQAGYPAPGAGYAPPPPAYAERRSNGVGGALVGGAIGAVAGNVIAGRGHRLEGTLIGAGVGGVAGYAVDRSLRRRVPVAPREGHGYPPPPSGYPPAPPGAGYAPPPAPGPGAWHSPDGGTVVTTSSVGGYYGGSTTVVTIQTAPVVTTTTTEIVEDAVTYTRHRRPVRHKWVRRSCGC